jgi:hypothetical protein
VTYDANAKMALLDPAAKLKRGTTYNVVGGTSVQVLAGNPLDQDPNAGVISRKHGELGPSVGPYPRISSAP